MRCPQCFNEIPQQSTFCLHCGNKIAPPTQTTAISSQPTQVLPPTQVIVKNSGIGRLLIALLLLAITGLIVAAALGYRLEAQKDWLGRDKPIVEIKKDGGTINLPAIATPRPQRASHDVSSYTARTPRSPEYTPPPTLESTPDVTSHPSSRDLVSGIMPVGAMQYRYIQFTVEPSSYQGVVVGRFSATGGQNDIDVLILPQQDFANWQSLKSFNAYYNSGYIASSRFKVSLPPGEYFLVFTNRKALFTSKVVEAYVELRYE